MGFLKEIVIWALVLIFGWILLAFAIGGTVGLSALYAVMQIFPILVKPILISGAVIGLIFLLGRYSK